jgi:hypothetical protein
LRGNAKKRDGGWKGMDDGEIQGRIAKKKLDVGKLAKLEIPVQKLDNLK